MDPETEAKVLEEIQEFINMMLWKMRRVAREFPVKIRVDVFFPRNEGTKMHFVECERFFGSEFMTKAEQAFLEYEKKTLVDEASRILKGTDSEKGGDK